MTSHTEPWTHRPRPSRWDQSGSKAQQQRAPNCSRLFPHLTGVLHCVVVCKVTAEPPPPPPAPVAQVCSRCPSVAALRPGHPGACRGLAG